ncbi:MAG: hypothetical protein HZB25_09620 [Candidatus Eisenbacteria bacterium]|nr:hypothetical protein [Candidatus Eisenbacteria bacterium]
MRPTRCCIAALLMLLALVPVARIARASWPSSPLTNLPVCTAASTQDLPNAIPDGAGGMIVAWQDSRGSSTDIYTQHVLASGTVDPAWPVNGVAVCTAANSQTYASIVSDGAGGAIISWIDRRSGTNDDIYAQHVLASGMVDPAWPANGRALCTAANDQGNYSFAIASDGSGGAIVAWADYRSGTNNDIYAQHVLASGTVDPAWPVNGRAVCTAAGDQTAQAVVSDGVGGAILAWQDRRSGTSWQAYAHHVLASGALDPLWPAIGLLVAGSPGDQYVSAMVTDGAGGGIVAWQDGRSGN